MLILNITSVFYTLLTLLTILLLYISLVAVSLTTKHITK